MKGAVERPLKIYESNQGYFMPQQFENSANTRNTQEDNCGRDHAWPWELPRTVSLQGNWHWRTITVSEESAAGEETLRSGLRQLEPRFIASCAVRGTACPHKIAGIGSRFCPGVLQSYIFKRDHKGDELLAARQARSLAKEEGILAAILGLLLYGQRGNGKKTGKGQTGPSLYSDRGER